MPFLLFLFFVDKNRWIFGPLEGRIALLHLPNKRRPFLLLGFIPILSKFFITSISQ
jgi:hypothetical protein